MPFLPDARITNSTTRYTLSENLPEDMKEVDEHILKPAYKELPLVVMTVLTQISLGGFLALFLGDVMLDTIKENEYQLQRTKRLLNENFAKIKLLRLVTLIVGGILLPLLALVFGGSGSFGSASFVLFLALGLSFFSEIADRFLFYTTVVPLGVAGGFFVGKQR